MKVLSLITVRNPEMFESCTLALSSLRVGFPTSRIKIFINGNSMMKQEIRDKCRYFGFEWHDHERSLFHADWIEEVITTQANQLLTNADHSFVIADGDCIFWSSCEHLMPPIEVPWKGFYVPDHMNEWSGTYSRSRIHPSLIFGNADTIMERLHKVYPRALEEDKEYCGWKPFHPVTVADNGILWFYDTLSVAFNAIGGQRFNEHDLACYDHLNSASFYDVMIKRFDSDEVRIAFAKVHELARTNPNELRGMWKNIKKYYDERF